MLLPIHSARIEDGELTFVLAGEGEPRPLLRLGEAVDVGTKLRVAALVLRKLSVEERAALAYLDVSLPGSTGRLDQPSSLRLRLRV